MFENIFDEYCFLLINLYEKNLSINKKTKDERLYNLFGYLINNGYKDAAEDLWKNVIRNQFIVKPL